MKRRFAMGLAAMGLLMLGVPMGQTVERKPNVVIIFADDLGYGDVGCYGATKVKTPNIDRLAAQGRMFTDAHSASAVCTPSRYALVTGQYPVRKNLYPPVFLKTGLAASLAKPWLQYERDISHFISGPGQSFGYHKPTHPITRPADFSSTA